MKRDDLREVVGQALYDLEYKSLSQDSYENQADAILSALDAAGMVVVPKEPTPKMCESYYELCRKEETLAVSASEVYRAMLAAGEG